ncbi:MAG: dTDP-4-dehydrorhamnose reductase [Lewinellaceae bacterium]|nr:dTDP-4-dehydrorhamnose reductase [Lewinellaceae bacterium]
MSSILITGASGQLGREFQALETAFPGLQFTFADRTALDVTDEPAVFNYFLHHSFDYCINCAAYTAVDKAESEPGAARRGNVDAPRWLAEGCARQNIPFIHYSTDYVYHNAENTPLLEGSPTTPRCVYAATKLEGEQAARASNPLTMIIRTSWVYSSFGHNFVKTMLRLGRERASLGVVYDQVGAPTYAHGLARATLDILSKVEKGEAPRELLSGIYNYSDEGACSWYDLALAIFEMANIPCQVLPIETRDYPLPALRPPYSLLNKAKIKDVWGVKLKHWRENLRACLETLGEL